MDVFVVNPSELNKKIEDGRMTFVFCKDMDFSSRLVVSDILNMFRRFQTTWSNLSNIVFDYWNARNIFNTASLLIGNKPSRRYSLGENKTWMRSDKQKVYNVFSRAYVTKIYSSSDYGKLGYSVYWNFDGTVNRNSIVCRQGAGLSYQYIKRNSTSFDLFCGISTIPYECRHHIGYLYYTNPYGAFEFFPAFCIAKKFRDKKGGRRPELFEIENTDTQEVVWELGIPMESLQRSLSVTPAEKTPSVLFQYFNEMLRSYVIYFAPPGHTNINESMSHWHRVAITSKNVQPDIHKTYVKVEVTAITEVLCPTIKPNAYDE